MVSLEALSHVPTISLNLKAEGGWLRTHMQIKSTKRTNGAHDSKPRSNICMLQMPAAPTMWSLSQLNLGSPITVTEGVISAS